MALNPRTYQSSITRQKKSIWRRIVALSLESIPETGRQEIWLEAHGFTRASLFPGSWYPPNGEAERYGMEGNTAYLAKDCLVALANQTEEELGR